MLRRQMAGPVCYEPADRFWFSALSALIPQALARGLPGYLRNPARLAPQVHRREVGLRRTPTHWTPKHWTPTHSQDPRGAGPTRTPYEALRGL